MALVKNQHNRTQVFLTQVWQTQRARLQKLRRSWLVEEPQSAAQDTKCQVKFVMQRPLHR